MPNQTIDSQVHAYEKNRPERPWSGFLQGPDEVTGDDMVAAMDSCLLHFCSLPSTLSSVYFPGRRSTHGSVLISPVIDPFQVE